MHMLTIEPAIHRAAVLQSIAIVDTVAATDLGNATPCAGWDLADLLAHMTVQHRGFAASARGAGADERVWDPATVAGAVRTDPAGSYRSAAGDALDAFGAAGIADVVFALPEFGPQATVPGSVAMSMHFVDYLVHGWDVAVSVGVPFAPPAHLVAAALPIVRSIPDDASRTAAGAPFGPARRGGGSGDLDEVLRLLGRDPQWRAPA